MTKKVLVSGCSFTMGHGLDREKNNPNLWVNQLFDSTIVKNIALAGRNNHSIFINTVGEMMNCDYDLVIVAWSVIPRFNFNAGLETYETLTRLEGDYDVNVNDNITFRREWLKRVGDSLLMLHNDHWDIVSLISYINAIKRIQETITDNNQVFFVNTFSPWSNGFFDYKNLTEPSELSEYEQTLLDVETRDDEEIFNLYDKIHEDYKKYGEIQQQHWLNLYNSFGSMQVDRASPVDRHPGMESQNIFSEYLANNLCVKLNSHNIKYLKYGFKACENDN